MVDLCTARTTADPLLFRIEAPHFQTPKPVASPPGDNLWVPRRGAIGIMRPLRVGNNNDGHGRDGASRRGHPTGEGWESVG
jgi:hypothetical protein